MQSLLNIFSILLRVKIRDHPVDFTAGVVVFLLKSPCSHVREKRDKLWFILDGELYSGTVSDFSGSDALIIKNQIRTGQYNLKELNGKLLTPRLPSYQLMASFTGPDFVSSIEDKDFVYFFFREEAVEYMNCGKVTWDWFYFCEAVI